MFLFGGGGHRFFRSLKCERMGTDLVDNVLFWVVVVTGSLRSLSPLCKVPELFDKSNDD